MGCTVCKVQPQQTAPANKCYPADSKSADSPRPASRAQSKTTEAPTVAPPSVEKCDAQGSMTTVAISAGTPASGPRMMTTYQNMSPPTDPNGDARGEEVNREASGAEAPKAAHADAQRDAHEKAYDTTSDVILTEPAGSMPASGASVGGNTAYTKGDVCIKLQRSEGRRSETETSHPMIKRAMDTALLADEEAETTKGGDKAQCGSDLNPLKAPSYRVRKSIATSRVRSGAANEIYDRYSLTEDILGTGISGAVRVAVETSTGRKYAIKTLTLENISGKKAAMLHNEVEIYLRLDHPNIAKLVEVYEDDKRIYLVMELCTGRELYDRLAAKKRYLEADAARVTLQMLEAINYCHKHRICHRDLKLENWVYASEAEDAQLKLIDFGFSRIFNPVIPMTAMHGTVYYVSPEVMDGCYREKCDIWSIGVIVYMLLSGTPPFNGTVDYQILLKIRAASFNFNAPVWQTISADAKDFISSLLVKDPVKRPSAEEALKHKWLQTASDTGGNEIDLQVLKTMQSFAVANVMKRAALSLVAHRFSADEVQNLHKEFKKLDKDHTGTIRLQDLVSALVEHLEISPKEATKVFERIDQTGDREVHYTEFLAATLHPKILTDESLIKEAFAKLDAQRTGRITLQDLRQVLGDSYNSMPIEDIMSLCDRPQKGYLSYTDFMSALCSPGDTEDPDAGDMHSTSPFHKQDTRASFSDTIVKLHLRD